jgi:lipopolysaccharide export system ATP-binding protein
VTALHAKGLTYKYGSRVVLDNLQIRVDAGEIVGLLGPNGAGKSTAFGLLAGTLNHPHAEIDLGGISIGRMRLWMRARYGLAYIPQRSTVLGDFTVTENVEFGLLGLEREKRAAARENILSRFGLIELAGSKGKSLSGGESRRVELARVFGGKPKVLLADEPFNSLDPMATQEVARLLRQFTQTGVGVLITDHDIEQTLALCDRIYIILDGRIICEGSSEDVAQNPRVRDTYLGERVRIISMKTDQVDRLTPF